MLGREQQQVVAAGADRVLEPDEHLVEERVLQVGVALAGLEEHADHVVRWVMRLRAAAAGV